MPDPNSPSHPHHRGALIQLHIAALMLGWAGVLAELIDGLNVWQETCLRTAIAAPLLFAFILYQNKRQRDRGQAVASWTSRSYQLIALAGVTLAVHWALFFAAVNASSVAIGQLATFTFPVMTALIEPLVYREKLRKSTLINAAVVVAGVMLLPLGSTIKTDEITLGIGLGLISAMLFTVRNLANRPLVQRHGGGTAMAWQCVIVTLVLSPTLLFTDEMKPETSDIAWLFVLGLVTTGIAHTMMIASFKHIKVATASIIMTLQPIYAAIYGWAALGQPINIGVVLGGACIIVAVYREAKR